MFRSKTKDSDPLLNSPVANDFMDSEIVGDLEDVVANKENLPHLGPRPIVRNYESNRELSGKKIYSKQTDKSQKQHQVLSSVNKNDHGDQCIDKNVDYQGWLDQKKRKWKETRERRKKLRYLRNLDLISAGVCFEFPV